MNHHRKKEILSDPISLFKAEKDDFNARDITLLGEQNEQYQNLKTALKEAQALTKAISRKIGEAKQHEEPFEHLMQSMQVHSLQIKQLTEALKTKEEELLAFFETNKPEKAKTQKDNSSKRAYKSTNIDHAKISISLLEEDIEAWNTYVANSQATSLYHRAEWKQLIFRTFGHTGFYYIAKDSLQNIIGILPLIRLNSRLFGDFMVSMPYFNYGGAVADHPAIEKKMMDVANEHAAKLGVSHIEYRDDIERSDLPARTDKVNLILPLPRDPDELWNSFSSKLRAQIKRPYRENPFINIGREENLDEFYEVFARNMRDLGTPVYAKSFFLNILEHFPDNSFIITIKLNNKPVAAGFLLNHGNMLEIPWASTIKPINHLSINMLMYWEVLKFAISQGVESFDFGRSTIDGGTYRFKRQWGAIPKQLYWHYWLNEGEQLPALNPSNPKYALMISIWKKIPVLLTKYLGPPIVKNLP